MNCPSLQIPNGGRWEECWGGREVIDWFFVFVCELSLFFCMANSSQTFSAPWRASEVWEEGGCLFFFSPCPRFTLESLCFFFSLLNLQLSTCLSIDLDQFTAALFKKLFHLFFGSFIICSLNALFSNLSLQHFKQIFHHQSNKKLNNFLGHIIPHVIHLGY